MFKKESDRHFYKILAGICGSFFLLGLLGKISQYFCMGLHAQDFWLFVDMLEQMKRGGFFLTRFAPQGLGFVQHGSVHPMFSWAVLVPFAALFGSVPTALVFNPLVLSAAGGMVSVLARKSWGSRNALLLGFAFLASTQVGKVLMYEVHPEAAYPLAVLLVLWSLGLDGSNQVRKVSLFFATLFCAGIKQDAVFVLFPWFAWALWALKPEQKKAAGFAGVLTLAVFLAQAFAVKSWADGSWGPFEWEGEKVVLGAGVQMFQGQHGSGILEILQIGKALFDQQGGWLGFPVKLGMFLVSRPWLSLIILAPWLLMSGMFWWVVLPLACITCMLGSPSHFWNYYSAPFLGSFWFCIVSSHLPKKEKGRAKKKLNLDLVVFRWVVPAALVLGGSSIEISFPSREGIKIKEAARAFLPCLTQNPGKGWVASPLLGEIPLSQVWTDRVPRTHQNWNYVHYILFSPQLDWFEMSEFRAHQLYESLRADREEWQEVGTDCLPVREGDSSRAAVLFLSKRDISEP